MMSASSRGSTPWRVLPRCLRASKVFTTVSVMRPCVSSEPPTIVNCSADVRRLWPSALSKPTPSRWAGLAFRRRVTFFILRCHRVGLGRSFKRVFLRGGFLQRGRVRLRGVLDRRADDVREGLVLLDAQLFQARQLQHGQEGGDEAAKGDLLGEELREDEALLRLDALEQVFHLVRDRHLLGVDLADDELFGEAAEDEVEA